MRDMLSGNALIPLSPFSGFSLERFWQQIVTERFFPGPASED